MAKIFFLTCYSNNFTDIAFTNNEFVESFSKLQKPNNCFADKTFDDVTFSETFFESMLYYSSQNRLSQFEAQRSYA